MDTTRRCHIFPSNWSVSRSPVFPRAVAESFAARDVQVLTSENPWTEPPAGALEVGMKYAARFLKDLDDFGRTSSNRLKVVLVGLGNAGKTSVAVRREGLASFKPLPLPMSARWGWKYGIYS